MPIICFDNVSFSYGGKAPALDSLSLSIGEGEFVCVLGANGSGKSTLAKHVNGLLLPESGEVRVLGCNTSDASALYKVRSGVGMVFQNPDDQIVASIVEDDVAFGPENLGVPPAEIRERVALSLAQVGLAGFELRDVASLSGGQKQRLAIAGALAMRPRILVLDEATSMLDPKSRSEVLHIARKLNEEGATIVMISHFVDEARHASRVVVLDGGSVALDGAPDEVLARESELEALSVDVPFGVKMARELKDRGVAAVPSVSFEGLACQLAGLFDGTCEEGVGPDGAEQESRCAHGRSPSPQCACAGKTAQAARAALISVKDVSYAYLGSMTAGRARRAFPLRRSRRDDEPSRDAEPSFALNSLSFTVAEGEFFGIAGPTGSGKSTLVQLLGGLLAPTSGRVLYGGKGQTPKSAAAAVRRDIGVVFQYPEHQLFAATVFDDVAFGPRNLGFGEGEVAACVRRALDLVGIDYDEVKERSPFSLSGGQQRRIALAGVLAMRPAVLMLDEPCAGLDPQGRGMMFGILQDLRANEHLTIVLVSHDMADLARYCDRILVLEEGGQYALDTPARVFGDEASLVQIGLSVPDEYRLAHRLGIAIDSGVRLTPAALADCIAQKLRQ